MVEVKVKLREYLNQHGLSAYRLANKVESMSPNTVYAYAAGRKTPGLAALGKLAAALEDLTGKVVEPEDLLEFVRLPELEEESHAWLEAELAKPLPSYDWSPEGEPRGKPVRYIPGRGFVVEGGKGVH